jgi:hypothetical protein
MNPNRMLDETRIASPCRADWRAMAGDDTVRFCGECQLNVYNISNMTADEAATLIERADGRLCVRLYKRADGTVITRDCPVGLRATMRRLRRRAGAVLAAALSLTAVVTSRETFAMAQDGRAASEQKEQKDPPIMGKIAIPRGGNVDVAVRGADGTAIPAARVALIDLGTGDEIVAEAGEESGFVFRNVPEGVYTLVVLADDHEPSLPRTVRVKRGSSLHLDVTLAATSYVTMGEIAPAPRDVE